MLDNPGSAVASVAAGRQTINVPTIPRAIIEQIRAQSRSARKGMESVGRIVMLNDGQAVRYDPLVNHATHRDQFQLADGELEDGLAPGEKPILVHSHPSRSDKLHPSRDDLTNANSSWLGVPYGVFLARQNALALFALNKNRRGYSTLDVVR